MFLSRVRVLDRKKIYNFLLICHSYRKNVTKLWMSSKIYFYFILKKMLRERITRKFNRKIISVFIKRKKKQLKWEKDIKTCYKTF